MTLGIGMAAVGAGYTIVLAGENSSSIVDFGAPRSRDALDGLERLRGKQRRFYRLLPLREAILPAASVVISHPHRDHFSGLIAYAGRRVPGDRHPLLRGSPAITNGANCLSLVIATSDRQLVFLGDLDESLHGKVAMKLADDECGVVISAHHGTHFGAALEVVRSKYVFSSVGGRLGAQVASGYSLMGMHLRTDIAGDIQARIVGDSIDISTCSYNRMPSA